MNRLMTSVLFLSVWALPGLGMAQTYCSAQGNSVSYEYIKSVAVGDLSNTDSSAANYSDFTTLVANIQMGASVAVSLTAGFPSSPYSERWRIFIDFNQNGSFEDDGELVFEGTSSQSTPLTGSFEVPSEALTGSTRMRVAMRYGSPANACGSFSYGEVEDYTVNISSADPDPDPDPAYCGASARHTSWEWIAGVKIGEFENGVNTSAGYEDFTEAVTSETIELSAGAVPVQLIPGFSGHAYTEHWALWIDVNKDGDFEDAGEELFRTAEKTSAIVNTAIEIPAAVEGKTRLRVRLWYSSSAKGPCGETNYGQVEDYTVQISQSGCQESEGCVIEPDPEFADAGRLVTETPAFDRAIDIEETSGGQLVLLDEGAKLVRLNADGSLDASFGIGGVSSAVYDALNTDFHYKTTFAAKVLPDDRIAVAAWVRPGTNSPYRLALAFLTSDGELDTANGGLIVTDMLGGGLPGGDLELQSDGSIVLLAPFGGPEDYSCVVARLSDDGVFDAEFGSQGTTIIDLGEKYDRCYGMVIGADDRIVIAATMDGANSTGVREGAVVQLDSGGAFDPAFGEGGIVTVSAEELGLTSIVYFEDLALQGSKIVATAWARSQPGWYNFTLVRFNQDGSLDLDFGPNGTGASHPDMGSSYETSRELAVLDSGQIVVAGTESDYDTNTPTFMVALFDTAGNLIEESGAGGKLNTGFGEEYRPYLRAGMVTRDGKYTAVGSVSKTGDTSFDGVAVAKYQVVGTVAQCDGWKDVPYDFGATIDELCSAYGSDCRPVEGHRCNNSTTLLPADYGSYQVESCQFFDDQNTLGVPYVVWRRIRCEQQ